MIFISFYTTSDICLMALAVIVVLNSVSGVNIIFVRFPIGHVYNKV